MSPTLLAIALLALLIILFRIYRHRHNLSQNSLFPKGPLFKLPLVGHLPYIIGRIFRSSESAHRTLFKWSQKYYGPIFSVQLGEYNTVVVNDYKIIKEILNDPRFNGRTDFPSISLASGRQKGILNNGLHDSWAELRRFSLNSLKDIGMGKKSMDHLMHIEITELLESLAKQGQNGQHVTSLKTSLDSVVLNILWTVMAGERLDQKHNNDDATTLHSLRKFITNASRASENKIATFLPSFAKSFPRLSGWNKIDSYGQALGNFQKQLIKKHQESLDQENPRDFIDSFLIEMNKCEDLNSSFYGSVAQSQLIAVLNDLLVGGALPTSTAMLWAILYLASHTEVQRKLQSEIDAVVGRTSLPTMAARPKMPYAIAVLMETLRKSSVFPLGTFHSTTELVNFHGYQIPKGTPICTNLWAAHHDPQVWGDPENYRPERFISTVPATNNNASENNGNGSTILTCNSSTGNQNQNLKLLRHEASLPFSFGKRACLGELLAKEQLFLFITSIFQRFNIKICENNSNNYNYNVHKGKSLLLSELLEPIPGFMFMAMPKPFSVVIEERA